MGKYLGMFRDQVDPIDFDPNQTIEELRDELLQDMADAGLVRLLPAPPPERPALFVTDAPFSHATAHRSGSRAPTARGSSAGRPKAPASASSTGARQMQGRYAPWYRQGPRHQGDPGMARPPAQSRAPRSTRLGTELV
jgi:hypothetical protein